MLAVYLPGASRVFSFLPGVDLWGSTRSILALVRNDSDLSMNAWIATIEDLASDICFFDFLRPLRADGVLKESEQTDPRDKASLRKQTADPHLNVETSIVLSPTISQPMFWALWHCNRIPLTGVKTT
ncbi:hypothetical protein RF11_05595 [Thelohanellus kitauei]|uniref:Uncharacterized protein n=1 Tax=Thelohanellus kitauei TaxID=669202 RepID=A0A0C2MFN2_THEKT|nr:hypothetical protein RF11_05595 [Thelohanellus kitauei]